MVKKKKRQEYAGTYFAHGISGSTGDSVETWKSKMRKKGYKRFVKGSEFGDGNYRIDVYR